MLMKEETIQKMHAEQEEYFAMQEKNRIAIKHLEETIQELRNKITVQNKEVSQIHKRRAKSISKRFFEGVKYILQRSKGKQSEIAKHTVYIFCIC